MTGRVVGIVCVLLGTAVAAQVSNPRVLRPEMLARVGLPAATGMTCREGHYAELGKANPAGDFNCQRHPGLAAIAIAIDVAPSSYAYADNPLCPGGNTDSTTVAMAKSQAGTAATTPAEVLTELQRRASLLGKDAPSLVSGGATSGSARCQLFVLPTMMAASAIRLVEFRAHQNQANDNPICFEAKLNERSTTLLSQSAGGCGINWSGWQSATLVDDPKGGAVVAGVFKNWSHDRMRTGQLWVWYGATTVRPNLSTTPK